MYCCQSLSNWPLLKCYFDSWDVLQWPLPFWRGGHCRQVKIRVNVHVWTVCRDKIKSLKRGGRQGILDCIIKIKRLPHEDVAHSFVTLHVNSFRSLHYQSTLALNLFPFITQPSLFNTHFLVTSGKLVFSESTLKRRKKSAPVLPRHFFKQDLMHK